MSLADLVEAQRTQKVCSTVQEWTLKAFLGDVILQCAGFKLKEINCHSFSQIFWTEITGICERALEAAILLDRYMLNFRCSNKVGKAKFYILNRF